MPRYSYTCSRYCHWFYRWGNPNCNGKLPPGTMGLPIVGETLQFVVPDAICDISPFIRKKMARYGPIFRTSLFGEKTIVCTDPDINHYIIQQEGRSVLLWYTEALNKVFGQQGILAQHGAIHKHLKNQILRLVGPENLKANILTELDALIRGHLQSWARLATVDLKKATEDMLFDYAARKLISYDESKTPMKFQENFNAFMYGLFSFPLDIPGTKYNKCVQGRKNSMKIIKGIIKERKSSKMSHCDFLNHLLEEIEREDSFLNEAHVVDMVILILFAVQETTSTSSTLVLKFISKHPDVLAELTKEHEAILKIRRDNKESDMITWEEYKSMTFTHMVITELVRLANFGPALCRKVIRDVEVNGK
ncbi:Cytochrome P450 87A3 [Morella rubra]|uniref:Cytochrome P450 87A3 n=1 Tax=Morella rubra TaxID=262757 RepID=A0A6A1VNH8_9ROSI|nr:Cytochrome P450 87A3 [Morella rubra]